MTLATQIIVKQGITPALLAASAGGDKCATGGTTFLYVKNASVGPLDVTLVTPGSVDGLAIADRTVSVPAGSERMIHVTDVYRNPADGLADITYPVGVTNLTVGIFQIA